ncbi:MAG: riboflavin synthase [Planctomycetota bacterium]|nr:riboflavin synthase [Planctomycetota bacterium]
MFTGLVSSTGIVERNEPTPTGRRLVIACAEAIDRIRCASIGDSIAVDGCCLTVVSNVDHLVAFDVVAQTLSLTTLGELAPTTRVHLEPALRFGDPIGGHMVQGHVDGIGTIEWLRHFDGVRLRVHVGSTLVQSMIERGSVAIGGVSLTLTSVDSSAGTIEVALIPETCRRTTLGDRVQGDRVNIEADFMVKSRR